MKRLEIDGEEIIVQQQALVLVQSTIHHQKIKNSLLDTIKLSSWRPPTQSSVETVLIQRYCCSSVAQAQKGIL